MSPATTSRTSDPASVLVSDWRGDAAGGRGDRLSFRGAGDAGVTVRSAVVMMAADSIARTASTTPYPAPSAERTGRGGKPLPCVAARTPPAAGTPPSAPSVAAAVLSVRARVTWATVRRGNFDTTRAATPATMPLAVLVLLIRV